jgi:FtsZ-interacting cell division protein ZipA
MRLTLYGTVILLITLLFIGYTTSRRERKKRYKLLLRMEEQRRKEYRTKRKDLINKIDELINDESHISEKYTIDMLKKMREAIAHDNITEAEKHYKLLDDDLSQCFEFLK